MVDHSRGDQRKDNCLVFIILPTLISYCCSVGKDYVRLNSSPFPSGRVLFELYHKAFEPFPCLCVAQTKGFMAQIMSGSVEKEMYFI